jgi:hypothetical protein
MNGACILAIVLLLGGAHNAQPSLQQDPTGNSNSSAQIPPTEKGQTPFAQDQPATHNETPEKPEEKKGPCDGKHRSAKCGKSKNSSATSRKIVIREGSTGEPSVQLAPGMTQEQARRQREKTEDLLNSTEENLKKLTGRALNQIQQDAIGQIRHYAAGARAALENGDLPRARNLAFKAHLLSDDLAKH